ncbi:pyruvate dehydrogenase (acetyl-transferring) E1 component subunit alpha [Oryzihumus sp.]
MSTRTRPRRAAKAASPEEVRSAARLGMLAQMVRIRRFEEACVQLYSQTRIRGFMHLCIGEEAVAAGVMGALEERDAVVSTYREHGHALARGLPMPEVMAEMFGRATGSSRGRGGSMHLFDTTRRFYGGNAIVAGGLPLAVGLGLAERMQHRDGVAVCFFGDGAAAEGEFHESLNLAALWRLPVLLVCENNLYAMGTSIERELAVPDLALHAAAYGMPAWPVDGMDVEAVDEATRRALDDVRSGEAPVFLEMRTYRFRAHSMYDPELYRDKAEVAHWRERDPVEVFAARLRGEGVAVDEALTRIEATVAAEIAEAVSSAEAAPLEPVGDLTRFVHSEEGPP